jgi:RNA polymerase sigma-70 factor (ECF subfamily)
MPFVATLLMSQASETTEVWPSLAALYAQEVAFIRSALLRLRGPGPEVEDLLQEVFLVAHRRWPEIRGRVELRGWLYGVCVRLVAAARRREKFRRTFGLERAAEPVGGSTPASVFEQTEATRRLYALLDKLPEKQRAVFVLFELEGCSGEQIAEAVGCPVATVWTQLFHARKTLARYAGAQLAREQREQGETP